VSILYCTADSVGAETGGGLVSAQELLALREFADQATRQKRDPTLSSVEVFSRANLGSQLAEPWKWDDVACCKKDWDINPPRLAHFYSGTFGKTVENLKRNGCKVVYTIAAHDRFVSRRQHENLGWPFQLPHLIEKDQWQRYIEGYRLADVIVCPGSVPAQIVRNYGEDFLQKDIRVIPHGCHPPEEIKPLPKTFVVGYAGSFGADKGIRYLLEAWKKLDYNDGSMLVLAGRDSTTQLARGMINQYGGGSIQLTGWQNSMSHFYNSISLYVQPSATEGFGLEVLEAASHGRPVICSAAAGAVDLVGADNIMKACNSDHLGSLINVAKTSWDLAELGRVAVGKARDYTWEKIREMYKQLWMEVLDGKC
jgi:glycosyltransferase involved in cell wall biosynthesis